MKQEAIQAACRKGALPETVEIVETEVIPLQYVSHGECRTIVKAVRRPKPEQCAQTDGRPGWPAGMAKTREP